MTRLAVVLLLVTAGCTIESIPSDKPDDGVPNVDVHTTQITTDAATYDCMVARSSQGVGVWCHPLEVRP